MSSPAQPDRIGGSARLANAVPGSFLARLRPDQLADLIGRGRRRRWRKGVALEAVEGLTISLEEFSAFLASHREAVWLLVEVLCERVRDAERKRVDIGSRNIARRLAQQLAEFAERYGEQSERGIRISLALTQDDLASCIGASREAVSKALRSLRMRGWIETGRRTVLILDVAALRAWTLSLGPS